jgi:hypothetical protein
MFIINVLDVLRESPILVSGGFVRAPIALFLRIVAERHGKGHVQHVFLQKMGR